MQTPTARIPLLVIVLLTGAALIYGTLDMPPYGDPDSPSYTSPITAAVLGIRKSVWLKILRDS